MKANRYLLFMILFVVVSDKEVTSILDWICTGLFLMYAILFFIETKQSKK